MDNEQIIHEATEAVEKGLPCAFLVPPCKVGERVYFTYNNNVYDLTIEKIVQKESGLFLVDKQFNDWYSVEVIGKTLFTSREDAVKALGGDGK